MPGPLPTLVSVFMAGLLLPVAVLSQSNTRSGSSRRLPPPEVICYKCVYMLVNGQVAGSSNCKERFRKDGIGTETCRGSCYKTYVKLGPRTFHYFRGCVTGCKEHEQTNTFTTCCTGRLCNGGTAGFALRLPGVAICLIAFLFASCILHYMRHVGIS